MASFKEELQKIYDGLTERLKSPFIITFLLVWGIQHWELVYTVCHFDTDDSRFSKIGFIKEYLANHEGKMFWLPLCIAGGSYLGYLILALVFEFIHEAYSKYGRAYVYYVVNQSKLVKKEEYEELQAEYDELNKKYDALFDEKIQLDNAYDTQEAKLKAKKDELSEATLENQADVRRLGDEVNSLKSEKTSLLKQIDDFRDQLSKSTNNELRKFKEWVEFRHPSVKTEYESDSVISLDKLIKSNEDKRRFLQLFSGNWLNNYKNIPHNLAGHEYFSVRENDGDIEFITNEGKILKITDIEFEKNKKLTFTKVNPTFPNNRLHNQLIFNSASILTGKENEDVQIEYRKL